MRLPADAQFLHEVERFALLFTCGNCLHFLGETAPLGGACGNGWPTEEHRSLPLSGEPVVFCKEFEVR